MTLLTLHTTPELRCSKVMNEELSFVSSQRLDKTMCTTLIVAPQEQAYEILAPPLEMV